jgi:hypothetical protein
LPETDAVPTVVPAVVQLVGAEDSGPKTLNVIVPEEFEPEEAARAELIALEEIAVPVLSVPGPVAVTVGLALLTTVLDIADPQVLAAVLLFASPPYDAYHQ